MKYWLGVVSHEHVRRGVELGIAQANHGKRHLLARMRPGDWLVYYSARERIRDGAQVHAFTAIGRICDDELWEAAEPINNGGCFRPWRRRAEYIRMASTAPLAGLRDRLDLTADQHWGMRLRRGLIELGEHDFQLIHDAMVACPAGQGSTGQGSTGRLSKAG
ncbi:MAG: EVE domain-containing protein [Segniliparus sp.]|uniref:EVE domain-containing protein n=1 Tax=Segniliparus sp. TaxID=2804064 RepID=UPI003F3C6461